MDGVSGKFWQYRTIGLTNVNRLLATLPELNFLLQVVKLLVGRGMDSEEQLVVAVQLAAESGCMSVWAWLVRRVSVRYPEAFGGCLEGLGVAEGVRAMAAGWTEELSTLEEQGQEVAKEREEVEEVRQAARHLLVQSALLQKQAMRRSGVAGGRQASPL